MHATALTTRRSIRSRLPRVGLTVLAGALVVSGAAATAASAQTKAAKKAPVSALEKSIEALETPPSSSVTLTEKGSSLFYPLFNEWSSAYPHSSVSIQAAAGGSGAGISGAQTGVVNIGASDAYLAPSQVSSGLMDIPEVVSAQTINYNIPGLKKGVHLKLNASVLNGIYTGSITSWNAPAITALNKGVSIPAVHIVPIHRSDGSGDTFLFTSYLYFGDPSSFLSSSGPNLSVTWPSVTGSLAENGNTGVLQTCQVTPGCIAYIGISYLNSELSNGIGYAAVANGKGNYELPTTTTISNEIASYKTIPASGGINLVDSKSAPAGYPIVNFEYAIVLQNQPNATTAQALKAVLAWGIDPNGGSKASLLGPVHFRVLPANAAAIAVKLIKSIS
jgi:phosphate transport system substrate-binding protein